MKRRMKSVAIILTVAVGATLVGTGCSDKVSRADLEKQNTQLSNQVADTQAQVEELKKVNQLLGGENVPEETIYSFSAGTGETYVNVGGNIGLPIVYEFENGTSAPNTSSVNITAIASVSPSYNWVVKQDGTKTLFYHQNGISGYIKAIKVKDPIKRETAQTSVEAFLNGNGYTVEYFNSLFLEDNEAGGYANGVLNVASDDTESATITQMSMKVGLFGTGENGIEFLFTYPKSGDVSCDELVMSLLKTLRLSNRELRVE